MCGIAGYLNKNGSPAAEITVRKMADLMVQRGPDGEGVFVHGNVAFGHRRLAVIDLAAGNQPMFNEDRSVVIVFNGEIFHFQELREELIRKGHHFSTQSDTEVIVHLYEEKGTQFLESLHGFFAIAIYDLARRTLILARDHAGIKPLYYAETNAGFAFASELRAIKPAIPDLTLRQDVIPDFLALQYLPCGTIYKEAEKLPPASYLTYDLDSNHWKIHSFWHPRYDEKSSLAYPDACRMLRSLVCKSVKSQMIADVPLGVFLSGGMDSAVIAAVAAQASERPLQCFSIGFEDSRYDEQNDARATADLIRKQTGKDLDHTIQVVRPDDFSILRELVPHFGEPYADASMLPTFLLSKFTRKHVTVALSGDGADELFAGYERYLAIRCMERFHCIPGPVFRMLGALLPDSGERTLSGRARRFCRAAGHAGADRYYELISHEAEDKIRRLMPQGPIPMDPLRRRGFAPTADNTVDACMELDLHTYLPEEILRKTDVCSMAASLEVRPAFLDYEIMAFAASLPLEFKLSGNLRKRILFDAFSDLLPPDLRVRKKRGFGVPVGAWFRSGWKNPLQECLFEGQLFRRTPIQEQAVRQMFRSHLEGRCDHSYLLFSLLMLELFFESEYPH